MSKSAGADHSPHGHLDGMAPETIAAHAGRDPEANFGIVNPPVYHASTILYPTVKALKESGPRRFEKDHVHYGRYGTPTTFALENAVAALEGGYGSIVTSSGYSAIVTAMLAFLKTGDHVLMVDSTYGPTRRFCDNFLKSMGIATTYYAPGIGAGIGPLVQPATKIVFLEAPGSLTFEMQDIPAIAKAAKAANAKSPPMILHDTTWASPAGVQSFALGVDVSIHAATKYIVGHSDAMLGMVVARDAAIWTKLKESQAMLGQCAGPDDVYLALRGVRTMPTRLKQHQATATAMARWLKARPEVARVMYPALPEDPGHALWKRDFRLASGLFSFELKPVSEAAVAAMLDGMRLFKMGFSWGGFESLMIPADPKPLRSAEPWTAKGPLLRVHAGLESLDDLIRDLEDGFKRLAAAR